MPAEGECCLVFIFKWLVLYFISVYAFDNVTSVVYLSLFVCVSLCSPGCVNVTMNASFCERINPNTLLCFIG